MATNIDIIYSPYLYRNYAPGGNVVLIDIARFTTTLTTALANGAVCAEVYPNPEIPLRLKAEEGYVISGENMGVDFEGFDFNNSPVDMTPGHVKDRKLAFCTTNGTHARSLIDGFDAMYAGSFLNASAIVDRLIADGRDVKLVCSGKGHGRRFSIEDTIFAGFVAKRLVESGNFAYPDDDVSMAILLWEQAKENPHDFVLMNSPSIASVYSRFPKYKADFDVLFDIDKFNVVPVEVSPLKFVVKQ